MNEQLRITAVAFKPVRESAKVYRSGENWEPVAEFPFFFKDFAGEQRLKVQEGSGEQVVSLSSSDDGSVAVCVEGGRRRDDARTLVPDGVAMSHVEVAGLIFLGFSGNR